MVRKETGIVTVPHLTCVKHSEDEIRTIVEGYAQRGNPKHLGACVAMRLVIKCMTGGRTGSRTPPELVYFIRKISDEQMKSSSFRGFGIGIAGFPEGHPGTPNRLNEMDYLKAKVDAGAGLHHHTDVL